MGPLDVQCLAERGQRTSDGRQVVPHPVGQCRRDTEAGQVDRDDLALGRENPDHRVPGLAVMPYAVEQQQRFARARPLVGDGQLPAAPG